jgi:hypothetical protein
MTAPTAGSFLLVEQYDGLDSRISAIEDAGDAGQTSSSSANASVTSTSYTGTFSAGGNQAVTVDLVAGQGCLVGVHVEGNSTGASTGARVSFAVSGAATEAATDNRGGTQNLTATSQTTSYGRVTLYIAPSTGSYTFTMHSKVASGSASMNQRTIFAAPQPVPT